MRTWSDTPRGPVRFRIYARPLVVAAAPMVALLIVLIVAVLDRAPSCTP